MYFLLLLFFINSELHPKHPKNCISTHKKHWKELETTSASWLVVDQYDFLMADANFLET